MVPLALADPPDVYRLEWAEAGEPSTCPFLALVDLGPEAARGQIRRAASDREMLVAWDNPDGPGHAPSGEACEDCGRGVVDLGTLQGDYHATGPATIAWDGGSFANVDILPWAYGISARIKPADSNCSYKLWSHISWGHVAYLLTIAGSSDLGLNRSAPPGRDLIPIAYRPHSRAATWPVLHDRSPHSRCCRLVELGGTFVSTGPSVLYVTKPVG